MGDPIRQLSPELIREHPALSEFLRYIQSHGGGTPSSTCTVLRGPGGANPGCIEVSYEHPHDGTVLMNFVSPRNGNVYLASLEANAQLLGLVSGHPTGRIVQGIPEIRYEEPTRQHFDGLCSTVKILGGDMEANAACNDSAPTLAPSGAPIIPTRDKFVWTAGNIGMNWGFFETWGLLSRRYSLRAMQRGLGPNAAARASLTRATGVRPGLLAASLGYDFSYNYLGDALGMTPNDHALERRALGFGGGYGAYRGANYLLTRFSRRPNLPPVSFAGSLLSAAIVEATVGRAVGDALHDSEGGKFFGATMGFLLPQFWRLARGHRMLPPISTAEAANATRLSRFGEGANRFAGRAMLAAFAADTAYLGINYLSQGGTDSGRENRILTRAAELQSHEMSGAASFGRGAAEFFAPALTRRLWTGDSYRTRAREELRVQADGISEGAESFLRHALLFGDGGLSTDPRFYTELNWDWLRDDNALRDVRTADGRELPVALVAEQLSDPQIYRRVVEGSDVDRQIAYIQRQFRGYSLSRTDAAEILGRIARHRVRASLGELQSLANPSDAPLAGMFDGNGSLRDGSDRALVNRLFPDQNLNSEQVLALRRVALATRILELRAAGTHATTELAAYTAVGRQIGLLNAEGNFVEGDEVALARSHYESHAAIHPTSLPPTSGNADFLREMLAASRSG